ncbi:MAG: sensor histidine kinase [Gammaproteobacteria bacterium]|jgi:signal transduction histidine kinase
MSSTPERRRSLEHSLQFTLGGLVLLVLIALALAGILAVRDAADDFVTTRLEHDAEALIAMLDPEQKRFTRAVPPIYNQPFSGHYYSVRFDDGSLLRSRSLWDSDLSIGQVPTGNSRIAMDRGPRGQHLLVRTAAYRKQQQAFTLAIAEDIGDFRSTLLWMLWTAVAVVMVSVLLLLLIQKRLLRRAFRQLDLVREDVRGIGRGERAALRTDVPSEIAPLVDDFNQLLASWRAHVERSRHAAGNLAHALKTPLSLILQHARKERDATVIDQAGRMHALIDRELDRARIAGSAMAGQQFRPRADIAEITGVIRQLSRDKRLELQVEVDAPEQLPFDQEDMLELSGNLLENAAKWAQRRVRLALAAEGRMRLVIEDDGPGVDSADRERILGRGKRLDEALEGHGIGLSIAREIVELYGGSIVLERSAALGGLCVTVELPLPE